MEHWKVYQIRISKEVHDFVNSDGESHTSAGEKYPEYKASLEVMRGYNKGWSDSYFQHYTNVCDLKVNGDLLNHDGSQYMINDPEEVFKILNQYYLDEDSMEDVVLDQHLIKHTRFHSLSVGDLIQDPKGNFYFTDRIGFHKFTNPKPFHDVLFNGWDNSDLGKRYPEEVVAG